MVKFNQLKERIKLEFIKLKSKSDLIQNWILHMYQYVSHNFQFKYQIEVILVSLERQLKRLQIIVKYNFPNSGWHNAKITPQKKNTILDES